jgi:hypothetical protein
MSAEAGAESGQGEKFMKIRPWLFLTAFGLSVLLSLTLKHSEANAQSVSTPGVTTSSPSLTPSTTATSSTSATSITPTSSSTQVSPTATTPSTTTAGSVFNNMPGTINGNATRDANGNRTGPYSATPTAQGQTPTTGTPTGLTNANGQSIFDNTIRSNSCMDSANQHLCGVEARDYCRQNTAAAACQNIISELKDSAPATLNY